MISAERTPSHILIAGGGIGGLAVAIALKRYGMESLVCERAPQLREVGAGLLLSPNAVHMLELLGIGQAARACSRIIKDWHILNQRGRLLHRMRPTTSTGTPTLSLHRGDLQTLLQSQLHASALRLNYTVTGYAENPDGVELSDQAGKQITGTALIGADGLNSRIRKLIYADGPPRFCGYTGWRSVVPWIPQGYEGNWLSESWGEGKRFGISPLGGNRCLHPRIRHRPPQRIVDDKPTPLFRLSSLNRLVVPPQPFQGLRKSLRDHLAVNVTCACRIDELIVIAFRLEDTCHALVGNHPIVQIGGARL
jgi:2-polyprenyl-6-methoxyphenol hydroxylase-like FAD-dependent oxidoreductase